jgi:hypothetical protein
MTQKDAIDVAGRCEHLLIMPKWVTDVEGSLHHAKLSYRCGREGCGHLPKQVTL